MQFDMLQLKMLQIDMLQWFSLYFLTLALDNPNDELIGPFCEYFFLISRIPVLTAVVQQKCRFLH